MNKKLLLTTAMAFLIFILIGCSGGVNEVQDDQIIILPPSRIGTEGVIHASLNNRYSFESAILDSDMVAIVKIGNWLSEDDELCISYFEASVVEIYKGENNIADKFVLLQDGTSLRTYFNYPIFTHGDELFLFMKKAVDTEFQNAFWIIGSFTTVLDVVSSRSGDTYLMDRYGVIGETLSLKTNHASRTQLVDELVENSFMEDAAFNYQYVFFLPELNSYFFRSDE